MIEAADGIGAASHAGNDRVGQPAFFLKELFFDFFGDHRLEITDNGREGMRAHDRAETVVGIADAGSPLSHRLGNRILEGCGACFYRDDFCAKQAHTVYIKGLANSVRFAHKDDTFHPHKSGGGCCGNTVLTGSRLGNQTGFPHLFGKKCLAKHVIDLMRPCVIEVFTL